MKKKNSISGYFEEQVENIKIPEIDYAILPAINKKRTRAGFIPRMIYTCAVLLLTFATILNWGNQSLLEKHIDSLDQKYEISRLIPEGLENFNKIMHEYFQKGENL